MAQFEIVADHRGSSKQCRRGRNSAATARCGSTAALFDIVVAPLVEDDAVLKVEQPKMGRPLPSRGFYFGLLALAVMGLWTLGGAFSLLTIIFSLFIIYAA